MLETLILTFQGLKWRWEDMCGPGGIHPWNPVTHDMGYCFQRLFLHIPILFLLSITSAYYVGKQVHWVVRGRIQEIAINFRCVLTLSLAIIPVIKIYTIIQNTEKHALAIDYFTTGTECLTWIIHFAFILALRHRLGISPRGPIIVLVLWSVTAVLSVISLRTLILLKQSYLLELIILVIQVSYAFTLLPSEGITSPTYYSPCLVGSQYSQFGEQQPLLYGFIEDEGALGTAMLGVTPVSKLLFHWVEPLFLRGLERKLKDPDDLFDLPVEIACSTINAKMEKALIGNVDNYRSSPAFVEETSSPRRSEGMYGSLGEHSGEGSSLPKVEVLAPRRKFNVSLFKALHKCFGFEFYTIGVLKLLADTSGFAGPLLLNKLVNYVEDTSIDVEMGYLFAGGLLISALLGAFCESHFNFQMALVSLKLRAAIITTVFRKTLTVTKTELNKNFSVGEITNFMSTDTDRIVNSCPSFHAIWSIPLQLGVTLFLLHMQVGISFLAGLVFSIVLIPINKCIANKIGQLSTNLMQHKDDRVSLMTEIIRGIRAIKLYVWEDHFVDKIAGVREKEITYLKGRKYLDAICVFLWATTPVVVTALTLSTYTLLGNQLTAATVFTTIALLNMLISPLNAFPWVLNGITEAWVSTKRIQRLLDLEDMNEDHFYNVLDDEDNNKDIILCVQNATFTWATKMTDNNPQPNKNLISTKLEKKKRKTSYHSKFRNIQRRDSSIEASSASRNNELDPPFRLTNLTFHIKRGDLVCIVGKVGSGKSSLLNAVLAEMIKVDGEISVTDSKTGFGYVSQKPWLQRGSIKDNILFGKAYEESKYRTVINACGLIEDIALLGSNACVGEGGSSLSGGQAARVALARAVYQDKQVYLLDDILSAVDTKVGSHIYRKCIMGHLKYKTRIFVTHSLQYVAQANHVIVMDNGTIKKQGPPKIILDELDEYFSTSDIEFSDTEASCSSGPVTCSLVMDNVSLKSEHSHNSMLEEENKTVGNVDFWVVSLYWKSIGHWLALATLMSLVLMQLSRNTTDLWLSYWVTAMTPNNVTNLTSFTNDDAVGLFSLNNRTFFQPPNVNPDIINSVKNITKRDISGISNAIIDMTSNIWKEIFGKIKSNASETIQNASQIFVNSIQSPPDNATNIVSFYLPLYAGFAVLNSIFTLIRAFLFAYGGIHAAVVIHKTLLDAVIKGKMKFFDITPAGRLLNRFSSDTYTVDDSLPFIMNILLAQVFGVIGSIIVTAYGLPWVCLVIVPLIPIYHWLQHRYRLTSRELKRLSSVTLSPIYSHFNDTLEGSTMIRALSRTERWSRGGEHLVERSQRAGLSGACSAQWLGLRLRLMGASLLAGAATVAVAQRNLDVVDAGLVGLAISYALTVTSLLGGVINAFTETEREMIAVERVGEYIRQIEPEESGTLSTQVPPPYGWPNMGIVSFNRVVMKYRNHLSPSLKGVTFDSVPAEKIGVVGRTGAGKSSLLAALFRLCELYSGIITIDSVNISQLPLNTLRSRLAIIPQEPFMFTGSIRHNLDPLEQYLDMELWNAIEKCGAKQIIVHRGGLEASAADLSRGHMQLLCLARAILQSAKVLCIDEATANVDQETDRLIQETIRCSFRKSTVITIAHRISTILDSDRVLVMGDGQVLEFDTPENLRRNPNSHFYRLINQELVDD